MGIGQTGPFSFLFEFLTAKKIISEYKQQYYNYYCKNPICDKKHDCHAYGNPKKYKTYHSFHVVANKFLLLYSNIICCWNKM